MATPAQNQHNQGGSAKSSPCTPALCCAFWAVVAVMGSADSFPCSVSSLSHLLSFCCSTQHNQSSTLLTCFAFSAAAQSTTMYHAIAAGGTSCKISRVSRRHTHCTSLVCGEGIAGESCWCSPRLWFPGCMISMQAITEKHKFKCRAASLFHVAWRFMSCATPAALAVLSPSTERECSKRRCCRSYHDPSKTVLQSAIAAQDQQSSQQVLHVWHDRTYARIIYAAIDFAAFQKLGAEWCSRCALVQAKPLRLSTQSEATHDKGWY